MRKWVDNSKKKLHSHNNATTTTLAVSTRSARETEAQWTWSIQFSTVLVNQELPVTY